MSGIPATVMAMTGTARAADFRYRLGLNQPVGSPMHLRLEQMADHIREESQGRMQIDVFPAGQLGADNAMLANVQKNELELYMAGNNLGSLVPVTEMPGLPFTFRDSTAVFAALDSELGDYIRRELAAKGLHAFRHGFENGFHHITSSTKPIRNAADLIDLKIRTPMQNMPVDFFESLGAKPMMFTFDKLYAVLKDRTVEAQTDPLAVVEVLKLYEVQAYLSLTNHWWSGFTLLANAQAWKALPSGIQSIVERNVEVATLAQRRDYGRLNNEAADSLRRNGMIVNETDTAGFRSQLAAFYARWKTNYGTTGWNLLEARVGKLT